MGGHTICGMKIIVLCEESIVCVCLSVYCQCLLFSRRPRPALKAPRPCAYSTFSDAILLLESLEAIRLEAPLKGPESFGHCCLLAGRNQHDVDVEPGHCGQAA